MTPSEFLSYLYANSGHLFLEGTAVAMTIGAVGHALSVLPWGWAKTAGGVLNGIYSDAFKILDTLKEAFAKPQPPSADGSARGSIAEDK